MCSGNMALQMPPSSRFKCALSAKERPVWPLIYSFVERRLLSLVFGGLLTFLLGMLPAPASPAPNQPQPGRERSFAERLLQPDRTQRSPWEGKLYRPQSHGEWQDWRGGKIWEGAAQGYNRTAQIEPKRFLGIPLPWTQADRRFPARQSALADKRFVTGVARLVEENPTRSPSAWDHGQPTQHAASRRWPLGERRVVPRGESHSLIDQHRDKMRPEELRALLNKHVPLLQSQNAPGHEHGGNPR